MQREKTMLIADDVELNRALLENIFDDEYSILQAADGVEAMEILRSQPVDVVLLDIVMPRMDGFEVLKTMKEEETLSGIPVIMATSEKEKFGGAGPAAWGGRFYQQAVPGHGGKKACRKYCG